MDKLPPFQIDTSFLPPECTDRKVNDYNFRFASECGCGDEECLSANHEAVFSPRLTFDVVHKSENGLDEARRYVVRSESRYWTFARLASLVTNIYMTYLSDHGLEIPKIIMFTGCDYLGDGVYLARWT